MKEKMIKFAVDITGHDQGTIEQMYKDWAKDYKPERVKFIRPAKVEDVICKYFKTTTHRVYKKGRKLPKVYYRQLIQFFMQSLTRLTDSQIGKRTGRFDRTTVLNNAGVIRDYYSTDKLKRAEIDEIEQRLTT